jgi:NADH dehydrogenase
LPSFPARLSVVAAQALSRLGVEVRLGRKVILCDPGGAVLDGERIESRTLIWAAGVAASPAAAWLGISPGRGGRIPVEPDLTVPGDPAIFAIGDTALAEGRHGPLPGLAPVAKQEGIYVAGAIGARLSRKPAPPPFLLPRLRQSCDDRPSASGRRLRVAGADRPHRLARLGRGHIYFLIGFRNRIVVALDWLWSYLTYQRGARLITGDIQSPSSSKA